MAFAHLKKCKDNLYYICDNCLSKVGDYLWPRLIGANIINGESHADQDFRYCPICGTSAQPESDKAGLMTIGFTFWKKDYNIGDLLDGYEIIVIEFVRDVELSKDTGHSVKPQKIYRPLYEIRGKKIL